MAQLPKKEIAEEQGKEARGTPPSASITDLLAAGREFYARRFPNPERAGCPSPLQLQGLAMATTLPDQQVRDHLFQCSECFNEYREARAWRPSLIPEQPATLRQRLKTLRVWQPAWAWATALLVLGAAIGIAVLWQGRDHAYKQKLVAKQNQSSSSEATSTPAEPPAPTSPLPVTAAEHAAPHVAPPAPRKPYETAKSEALFKRINLDSETSYRSATIPDNDEGRGAKFRPALYRLQILLPVGSQRGIYKIKLCDVFNQPIRKAVAVASDGKRIETKFDLRQLANHSYYLRIGRQDETPYFYKIVINRNVSGAKSKP
ncbi:MAG: hypothetical protein HY231_16535 [Acidobacteria bacterium]|nr:hypothetical protein [Acidobacteriota bacterium]